MLLNDSAENLPALCFDSDQQKPEKLKLISLQIYILPSFSVRLNLDWLKKKLQKHTFK